MEFFIYIRIPLFILLSIVLIAFSWKSLHDIHAHGFYRFFAFEGILILLLINIPFWNEEKLLSPLRITSSTFLFLSLLFVYLGFRLLKKWGGSKNREMFPSNFKFENTITLVTNGIYRYIRHPMYSSLLLLAWGIFFRHISIEGLLLVLTTSIFIITAAKKEELENIVFFGSSYEDYMKKTKMFIPYLF